MTTVEHWNDEADGLLSEAKLRAKLEALGYSVTCYTYPPGTYFPDHTHGVDKIDAVLAGRFRMNMGGQSVLVYEKGARAANVTIAPMDDETQITVMVTKR